MRRGLNIRVPLGVREHGSDSSRAQGEDAGAEVERPAVVRKFKQEIMLISCEPEAAQLVVRQKLKTVKRHLRNTYTKMEVGSRGEAVRKALHDEWITISEITEREQEEEEAQPDGWPG